MSSEMVRAEWVGMLPAVGELASKIAGTDFVPKGLRGNVAAVAACILTGHELGLGPMLALRGIVVIQGRVTISGELLGGMVLARGHALEWGESTADAATVTLTRGDGLGSATVTYTMEMARRAGLTRNDTYKNHPEAMLRARALSAVVKMIAPDVSLGLESAAPDILPPDPGRKTVQLVRNPPSEPDRTTSAPASRNQIKAIMARLPSATRDDRTARLAMLASVLGVDELETMNDLSSVDASTILERLPDERLQMPEHSHGVVDGDSADDPTAEQSGRDTGSDDRGRDSGGRGPGSVQQPPGGDGERRMVDR